MSAGVEIESILHEKYNAKNQIDEFIQKKVSYWLAEPVLNRETRIHQMFVQFL
jgi:hypothetical protein